VKTEVQWIWKWDCKSLCFFEVWNISVGNKTVKHYGGYSGAWPVYVYKVLSEMI
jgi:hypothetical protein